jgi:hypothetical protein
MGRPLILDCVIFSDRSAAMNVASTDKLTRRIAQASYTDDNEWRAFEQMCLIDWVDLPVGPFLGVPCNGLRPS